MSTPVLVNPQTVAISNVYPLNSSSLYNATGATALLVTVISTAACSWNPTVTYAGVNVPLLSVTAGYSTTIWVFGLASPTFGTNNLVISYSGSSIYDGLAFVTGISGTDTTSPFDGATSGIGNGTSGTLSITTTSANDLLIAIGSTVWASISTSLSGTGWTPFLSDVSSSPAVWLYAYKNTSTTPGSYSTTFTASYNSVLGLLVGVRSAGSSSPTSITASGISSNTSLGLPTAGYGGVGGNSVTALGIPSTTLIGYITSGSFSGFPITITPSSNIVMTVTFSPLAVTSYTGTLVISSNNITNPTTIDLSGVGVAYTYSIVSVTFSGIVTPTVPTLLPISASGNQFVDSSGNKVRLKTVSWYGYDGPDLMVHGLYAGRYYKDMIDQIVFLGFNCIRLPFSDDMVYSTVTFNATSGNQYVGANNADLIGLTPLQGLAVIAAYCAQVGVRIILDHHRISMTSTGSSDSGYGTDGWPAADPNSGTLYLYGGSSTPRTYTPATWASMWSTLATHCTTGVYASNPAMRNVIAGFDPHNEPYKLTWSTWAGMVETLFPIVNAIAPDWMMFVEGVGQSADGSDTYWWGGYLKDVATRPVNFGSAQNKLAYSPHDYGQSVSTQTWLSSVATVGTPPTGYPTLPARTVTNYPQNLQAIFEQYWGFIFTNNIAPIWLGEFGGGFGYDSTTGAADPLQTSASYEIQWLQKLSQYLNGTRNDGSSILTTGQYGMSFGYFAINPESGNPLGGLLLNSDYTTVQTQKMILLLPLLEES